MRIALYPRVSTADKGQDPENQLTQLREWCAGHVIAGEYVDHESGRKAERKAFAKLFDDAAKRRFDCVLFWSVDRFSREGMIPTILHLQRLAAYGVAFHSYTEPHLATDNGLSRNVLLAALASLEKVEAQKISERTKRGAGEGGNERKATRTTSASGKERNRCTSLLGAGQRRCENSESAGRRRGHHPSDQERGKPMIVSKANVLTLALLMAKQAVDRSIRDTGRKLRGYSLADRQRMAQAHLEANPGLVEDAERKLKEWIARSP